MTVTTPVYLSQLLPDAEMDALLLQYPAGLELIDFSIGVNLDKKEEFIEKWSQKLKKTIPLTLHGPFLDLNPMSYEPYVRKAAWQRFTQVCDTAVALKADKVIIHTCRVPQICYIQGWAQRLAVFWNEFLPHYPYLQIAIENVFDEDPTPIADFASQVKAPNFSLCLDVGHAHVFSKIPPLTWVETLSPWISHLHLHDNHGMWDEHLPLLEGSIPWENLLPVLLALPGLTGITLENNHTEDFQKSLKVLGLSPMNR